MENRGLRDGWYPDFSFLINAIDNESNWNQEAFHVNHHRDGSVSTDWGLCQVNDFYWDRVAREMNLDYKNDAFDNLLICVEIFNRQGRGAFISMQIMR